MGPDGGFLPVGDGHRLWVKTEGRGQPVLVLHGGPGSGCSAALRGLFDPDRHRAIFLDQRGAGKSEPNRSRAANTTAHLLADIERLRQALGIDSWHVYGGSWGATLALAYAQTHPDRVRGMVLRSVFLGTAAELDWAFTVALPTFYPTLFPPLQGVMAGGGLPALWQAILHPDPARHRPAALAFYRAERALSKLSPAPDLPDPGDGPWPATPFMEAHYFAHDCFLAPGQLLRDAGRLKGIPGEIIQPLQDLLCPPATSARLAAAWQDARVITVPAAGHSLSHPPVFQACKTALARLG